MIRALACLAVLLAVHVAPADDPKPAPAAKVVVSGQPVGRVLIRTTAGGETTTVRATLLKLDDRTTVAVVLPAEKNPPKKAAPGGPDPDLEAALREATGRASAVAAEGRLSSTDDPLVVAAAGPKGAKTVPLVRADKLTDLTDANRKDFPPPGSARVEGVLAAADVKLGPDAARWVVGGEPHPVPLLLPADGPVPAAGAKVRAAGPARVVDGRFVVAVRELAIIKGE